MLPSVPGLLVAALCAVGASAGEEPASLPGRGATPASGQERSSPPEKVVLQTAYFGTVEVDHAGHVAGRADCKDCHGTGPITAIHFTPKVAHARCRGCHVESQAGPTDCRGCHLVPPKDADAPTSAAAPAAGPDPAGATAPAPRTADAPGSGAAAGTAGGGTGWHTIIATPVGPPSGSAGAATEGGPEVGVVTSEARQAPAPEPKELRRSLQLGAAGGEGFGISARITSRQGRVFLTQGLDRLGGAGSTRTEVLLGAGAQLPLALPRTLQLLAEGVAGVEAVEQPLTKVVPALGGRLGLAWSPTWSHHVDVLFSVTGLLGLGGRASPGTLYATLVIGVPLLRL